MDEGDLRRFCDLTEAQWWDLKAAYQGTLKAMNGARRAVMADLINEQHLVTPTGEWVARRAQAIEEYRFTPRRNADFERLVPSELIRRLRRTGPGHAFYSETGYHWLRTAHVKLLVGVHRSPDEVVGWMRTIFGQEVIREAVTHLWLKGTMRRWSMLETTPLGLSVLQWGMGLAVNSGQLAVNSKQLAVDSGQ